MQLRGGESGSEKSKYKLVPREVWDKRKEEGSCMNCRRSNHQARDCKALSLAKSPLSLANANQGPVQKKRKFDRRHLKITELASKEDSGNE